MRSHLHKIFENICNCERNYTKFLKIYVIAFAITQNF